MISIVEFLATTPGPTYENVHVAGVNRDFADSLFFLSGAHNITDTIASKPYDFTLFSMINKAISRLGDKGCGDVGEWIPK